MTRKASKEAKKHQTSLQPPVGRAVTDSDVIERFKEAWPIGLTRRQLAESLGRQVTPTLINRIEKFVDAGWLTREMEYWPNGARGYKYTFVLSQEERSEVQEKVLNDFLTQHG